MNMGVYFFESLFSFLWDIYAEVVLLGHMAVLLLIFEKPPHCFSQWLHQITFPPLSAHGFALFHFLPHTCHLFLKIIFCFLSVIPL